MEKTLETREYLAYCPKSGVFLYRLLYNGPGPNVLEPQQEGLLSRTKVSVLAFCQTTSIKESI